MLSEVFMQKYFLYDATKNLYLVKREDVCRLTWGKKVNRFGSAILLNEEQVNFWVVLLTRAYGKKFVALPVR